MKPCSTNTLSPKPVFYVASQALNQRIKRITAMATTAEITLLAKTDKTTEDFIFLFFHFFSASARQHFFLLVSQVNYAICRMRVITVW